MFKWLYSIIIIIALTLLGAAVYYWQTAGGGKIELIIKLPEKIVIGVPFDASIGIANNSEAVLNGVRLTISLPAGIVFVGNSEDKNVITRNIGDVGLGGLTSEELKLMAVAQAQIGKAIEATLNYSTKNTPTHFEIKKSFETPLASSGIELKLATPATAASSEKFELKISYKNISDVDFDDLKLKIDYPPLFKFTKATLKPDSDNNTWLLGALRKNSSVDFSVFGQLIAPANTGLDFNASLQRHLSGQDYAIAEEKASVNIAVAPFEFELAANNDPNYVARPGEALNYTLRFSKPLDTVQVQLTGEMFDWSAGGGNTFNWSGASSPLTFQARVKNTYPLRRLGDKNFLLKAVAEGRSGGNVNVARLETKVAGRTTIVAKGYFRDAQAGIINSGPLPPRVGRPTDFTIHWLVSNYGTDVKDVIIRTVLPSGVSFSGKIKSDIATAPAYNASTNEVIWKIDRLLATQGAIDQPVEAVFQVQAIPSANQIGQYLPLAGETQLTAADEFSGINLTGTSPLITTALPDDSTVGAQGMIVK